MVKQRKNIVYGILFAIYAAVNLALLCYHEPWRDEAQVWLLSRDLPLWRLPAQMAYEGHPCLWHVLMYPFAHFGLPYILQNVAALVIVLTAAALLLFRSHFPLYGKAVLLFSPFLTYYYPVIARSYCMIPLLLFLLAYWYPGRFRHPVRYALVAALLVQSHAVMAVTAFAVCLCYFIESFVSFYRDRQTKAYLMRTSPLLLPLLSAFFLLYELMSVEKSSLLNIKTASVRRTIEKILEKTAEGMETLCGIGGRLGLLVFFVGVVFMLWIAFRRRSAAKYTVLAVLIMTYCFQFWFYAMVYNYSMQRLMTFPLLIIWGMWILRTEETMALEESTEEMMKTAGIQRRAGDSWTGDVRTRLMPGCLAFCVFALLALYHSVPDIWLDVTGPYSNGREAAAFIRESLPQDAVILTDNQAEATAIFPYLDKKEFIYAPNGDSFTYVTWDEHWMDRTDYDSFRAWLDELDTGDGQVYMISCLGHSYIDGSERLAEDFTLVYQSKLASVKEEDYQIFRLR